MGTMRARSIAGRWPGGRGSRLLSGEALALPHQMAGRGGDRAELDRLPAIRLADHARGPRSSWPQRSIGLVLRAPMTDDIGVFVRVVTILVAGLMFAGSARADEAPPPSFFACASKSPGDACEGDFGAGACVASTCSRLDYSKGSPPETVSQDCLKCQPPAPPTPPVQTAPVQSPPATSPAPEAPRSACRIGHGAGAPVLLLLALATMRRRRGR